MNLLNLKQSSDRLGIISKGFLKLPNLHMLIKQRSASLPRNLALGTFCSSPEMLSSAPDKAKLFAENLSKISNIDDSGISLPVFPSRTNMKLHNIFVTSKIVKKVITSLDLSKASGPDCIPAEFFTY